MLFAPSSVQNLHVRTDIRYLIMWQTEGRSKKKRFFCWRWHGDGDGMAMAPRRRTRRTLSQIEIESGAEQFEVVCYVVIALLLILLK